MVFFCFLLKGSGYFGVFFRVLFFLGVLDLVVTLGVLRRRIFKVYCKCFFFYGFILEVSIFFLIF